MQQKGIVMQIANGQAVVMTKDCEFRKIPYHEGMVVGQEVEVPNQTTQTVRRKPLAWFGTPLRRTGVLAASVLLAVGVWGSQALFPQQSAYAYVSVDINPSVEFSIDNQQHVMNATALNDDGQLVLTGLQVKGLPVNQAVQSLTEVAKNKGFFHQNTEVIITASPAVSDDKLASDHMDLDKIESDLVAQVKTTATTDGSSVDVEGIRVSQQVRDAAKQAGLSPGKYALYLNAQSNGINVSVDELKQKSITAVVSEHGDALSHIVQTLEGGQKLDSLLDALKKDGKITPQNPAAQLDTQSPQPDDQGTAKQPPGQQKKDDGSKPGNSDKKDNASKTDHSSDRETGDKGNSGHDNGNGKNKDDGEHDRGNHGGKDKKGSENSGSKSFFSGFLSWFEIMNTDHAGNGNQDGNGKQTGHDKKNSHEDR